MPIYYNQDVDTHTGISAKISVRYEDPNFPTLQVNENGNWIDLKAAETVSMTKGEFKMISLGVAMKLPENCEAYIAPRSSTFKNFGIIQTNSIGIIDNSYSGNDDIWKMPVYATRDTVINKGDRIAQFRIVRSMEGSFYDIFINEVDQLDEESRGGFGSTGIN